MRVLHVLQELSGGGAENVAAQLVTGAQEAGCAVAVAGARGPARPMFDAPTFHLPLIARKPLALLRAARALRRAIATWRPDLVHCHNPTMALAVALATGRKRPARIVTVHGISERDAPLGAALLRWLGAETVACAASVATALRARRVEATLIANGCGPAPPPLDRGALEAAFGGLAGRRLVVGVGRLVAQKNHALLIRAAARMPDAVVVIAGEGVERAALEDEAVRAGVAGRVHLCGHRDDAHALIAAADALVVASRWEGLPLVVLEAMSAGTPVVAVRAAWNEGLLEDGDDCLLVPPDDPRAIAGALDRLAREPALAARIATRARERAARHSGERMTREYLDLYEAVIRRGARA
jgi:glycosyltransferase involved in cell wall biosynthesis